MAHNSEPPTEEPTKLGGWSTGGYEDPTPDPDGNRAYLLDDDRSGASGISHPLSFLEAGFDLTEFSDASSFRQVLWNLDLEDDPDVIECYPNRDDLSMEVYVWANDDLTLITACNPLTGAHGNPLAGDREPGYAGSIGIEGTVDAVEHAFRQVTKRGNWKGRNRTRREYL